MRDGLVSISAAPIGWFWHPNGGGPQRVVAFGVKQSGRAVAMIVADGPDQGELMEVPGPGDLYFRPERE